MKGTVKALFSRHPSEGNVFLLTPIYNVEKEVKAFLQSCNQTTVRFVSAPLKSNKNYTNYYLCFV
jgi:hypothetical protein